MTTEPNKSEGVDIAYFYAGLRMSNDGKGEFVAIFKIVDEALVTDDVSDELNFTKTTKSLAGAQIGGAYNLTHRGGTKWALPPGGTWFKYRVDGKVATDADRGAWQVSDAAAKQTKAAMKWKPDDAIERAIKPMAAIYWRIAPNERAAFELMIIRELRKVTRT